MDIVEVGRKVQKNFLRRPLGKIATTRVSMFLDIRYLMIRRFRICKQVLIGQFHGANQNALSESRANEADWRVEVWLLLT